MRTSQWPRCWRTWRPFSRSASASCTAGTAERAAAGALEARVVIERAEGINVQHNTGPVDQAYQLMLRHARNNNTSLEHRCRGDRCPGPDRVAESGDLGQLPAAGTGRPPRGWATRTRSEER